MIDCTHCAHAAWAKTAAGKMHPSGDGRCTYIVKIPPLPACMGWGPGHRESPTPYGGYINRREPLKSHCVYWKQKETQ
jgi:hypothetical protein